MKTKNFSKILFSLLAFSTGLAAEQTVNNTVYISGPKFSLPLIETWISEYSKIKPESQVVIIQKTVDSHNPDLNIVAHTSNIKENQDIIYAGRYALLPIANSRNPLLESIGKKGLNKKEIDKLFFDVINYDEEPESKKHDNNTVATIYTPENQTRISAVLAGHFGHVPSEIRGKKVLGDDIYLLNALNKDSTGIAYNNLSFLFDTNSRRLKSGITILPLNLRKEEKEILSGNVDDVIAFLEKKEIETIPVEKFGFAFSQDNSRKEVSDFLRWVLNEGQRFNHKFGFLELEGNDLITERKSLETEKLLTLK